MTAFNKKIFKGLPVGIKVRKPRYYYQDFVETYTENTTKDINLTKFEGVNYEIDKYFINFESKVLWNRNLSPEFKAALVPYGLGEEYITTEQSLKYNVVGSPVVVDGVASGFSGSKYIQIPNAFKPANESWEFVLKLTLTTNTKQQRLAGCVGGYYKTFGMEMSTSGIVGVGITSNGSSWDVVWMNGVTALQVGIPYWIKVSFTGTKYKLELSTDGVEYTLENSKDSTALLYQQNDSIINIGYMGTETAKYFQGSIDLNESYIKIGSKYVWGKNARYIITTGGCFDEDVNISLSSTKTYNAFADNSKVLLSESNEDKDGYAWAGEVVIPPYPYEPVYKRYYDMVGSVTIDGRYIASNFSSSNYLKSKNVYKLNDYASWSIEAKVKVNTLGKYQFWHQGLVAFGLDSSNKIHVWCNDYEVVSSNTLEAKTWYWVKLEFAGGGYFTGGVFKLYYKTSVLDDWIECGSLTVDTALTGENNIYIGVNPSKTSEYLYGEVSLTDYKFVDGNEKVIWSPLVDVIWDESDKELM